MHNSHARLIGAREAAARLLYGADGIPLSWPDRAGPYRDALRELVAAVDEAVIVRYAINPDFPEEGTDLRVEIASHSGS